MRRNTAVTNTLKAAPVRLPAVGVAWGLFTVLFWIAASRKGYHADEFYSWVYAARNSWRDILLLKDTGIGHPPLYHLIQKVVQTVLPMYHPAQVRLANYFLGSAFIFVLARTLAQQSKTRLFYLIGICGSACLLEAFVFSRMWGALCLVSLLLLRAGEEYLAEPSRKTQAGFLLLFGLGLLTDYSFIILTPYAAMVLLSKKRYGAHLHWALLSTLLLVWVGWVGTKAPSTSALAQQVVKEVGTVGLQTGIMLFGYWFQEPLLLAMLCLALAVWVTHRAPGSPPKGEAGLRSHLFVLCGLMLMALEVLRQSSDAVRARYVALGLFPFLAVLIWKWWGNRRCLILADDCRLILTVVGGSLFILIANRFLWRDLLCMRFFLVLAPFYVVLMYRHLSRGVLQTLSAVLLCSGVLYVSSGVIDDVFPPSPWGGDETVVFQNEFAYATQYFQAGGGIEPEPYLLKPVFAEYCRTCSMGTTVIPFQLWEKVVIIGDRTPWRDQMGTFRLLGDRKPQRYLPENFRLAGGRDIGLSWSDRYQLSHFRLLIDRNPRFKAYEYWKVHKAGG
jgi:hypothetical protein